MPLRNYSGPGLGRGSGWECPNCGAPNGSPRGSQCVSCGFPPDQPKVTTDAPPVLTANRDPEGAKGSPLDAPLGSNAAAVLPAEGERQPFVRRYKLIEYYGPADWVETAITRSLFGAQSVGTHGYLIGTEVSEAAIASQTELLQRVTEARSQDPTWEAGFWAEKRPETAAALPERPDPPTVFQQTIRAMEDVMEKDPRYARTMALALNDWVEKNADSEVDPTLHLTPDEVSQVVHILTLITTGGTPEAVTV